MGRETELYKDKIEVSLDGRQIFYLMAGGSVIVGLVFVLGVMVGRRVEARGHVERAQTASAVDPLAALDRLEAGGGLSFQGALRGTEPPTSDVEKTIGELAKARAPDKKPAPAPAPAVVVEKPAPIAADKPAAVVEKPPEKKPRFTLQLSSFKDKVEAQDLQNKLKTEGYTTYITEGDVDGKTFFRVRLGGYRTLDAANDARVELEKATKKTASVMKL